MLNLWDVGLDFDFELCLPTQQQELKPISACSGPTLAQASSAHACSALAEDPKPFKARGGLPPLALFAFGSEANAEHA